MLKNKPLYSVKPNSKVQVPPLPSIPEKGMDEGKKRIAADILMAAQMDDQSQSLKQMLKLMKMQISRGETRPMDIYFTGGKKMIQIDFLKGNESIIPAEHLTNPSWVNFNVPNSLLFQLSIYNDGPGTIKFAVNREKNSTECDCTLVPPSTYEIKSIIPNIRMFNVRAVDKDALVRLVGVV